MSEPAAEPEGEPAAEPPSEPPCRTGRAGRLLTWTARVALGVLALAALLHPGQRPGELIVPGPAEAAGAELRLAPIVVHAVPAPPASAPPAATAALPAPSSPMRSRPFARRAPHERARAGEPVAVQVTAYCLRGLTRRGNPVRLGIAAADPKFFPLGRHVDVYMGKRLLGRFLVDDTGGVVRGPILDVWTSSCDDARRFGRRRATATLVAADRLDEPLDAEPRAPAAQWLRD